MKWLLTVLLAVAINAAAAEALSLTPTLAQKIVKRAAALLPAAVRSRYEEEWLGELDAAPGLGLLKLAFAVTVLLHAPATRIAFDPSGLPLRRLALVRLRTVLLNEFHPSRTAKRGLDLVLGATAVVPNAPLFVLIAGLIKVSSPGPVFVRQERVGRNGSRFYLLKFRTMYVDGEKSRVKLAAQNASARGCYKLQADPRVTPVGRVLRRMSLDEFPQFINVIRGEMSIVGPRPPLPSEVARYDTWQHGRLKGMPGITGLWQVSGRRYVTFDDMVRLDRYYLDNWSFRLDLSLIFRTFRVAFRRRGPIAGEVRKR